MKQVLEPLSAIPGVRIAVLVTSDGVPVVVRGRASERHTTSEIEHGADSLAALAAGWLNALTRAVAPLSWTPPERVVLRATRGTIVMVQAPGSVLLALLEGGARPEDLRLPMKGAVARIQRLLRRSGQGDTHSEPAAPAARPAAPPLPTRDTNTGQGQAPDPTDNSPTPIHREPSG